ncbi:hypothetical protein PBI_GRAYSON_13 [Rhodococcus phage Grayson]|nr:hypothetical protein PBI_GRAYSON_13 [Rhodococcus phage Grayson]
MQTNITVSLEAQVTFGIPELKQLREILFQAEAHRQWHKMSANPLAVELFELVNQAEKYL